MTPLVHGEVYHFESRGLYDGVSILWDEETGSIWDHITGEAVYGPMTGYRLPTYNLLHTNAEEALAADPELQIAISDRPLRGDGPNFIANVFRRLTSLRSEFTETIAQEDTRRPTMEVGLGIWIEAKARYYPMERVLAAGEALVDELDGRSVVVYVEPRSRALAAFYAGAQSAWWEEDALVMDSGKVYRDGALYEEAGIGRPVERPMQLFTRWYGFALTFPETEIYEQ